MSQIKAPSVRYTLQPPQDGSTHAHVNYYPGLSRGCTDVFLLDMTNDQHVATKTYTYELEGCKMEFLKFFQDEPQAVHQTIMDRYFKDHIAPQMIVLEDTIQFPSTDVDGT